MEKETKILIMLTEMKEDIKHMKNDVSEIKDIEARVNRLESFTDRIKGMAVIVVAVFTVGFTMAYEYVKKLLGL